MRLNMWLIANRLRVLEPELHLREDKECEIRGIRLYSAEGYALVYENEKGIICRYDDEYLILRELTLEVALGLLQDVFDFYDVWFENLYHFATHMDFDHIIDSCYPILGNPLLLLDSNYKVISMSRQYGAQDVDEEWKYLSEHGFSSVKAVQFLREKRNRNNMDYLREKPSVRQQQLDEQGCVNMSMNIFAGNIICGHLVTMQKDREFNPGDVVLLRILADILSPYIDKINFSNQYVWGSSVFSKLLSGASFDEEALSMQMKYYRWNENDIYHMIMIGYKQKDVDDMLIRLLRSSVLQITPFNVVEIIDKQVLVICNENRDQGEQIWLRFKEMAERNGLYLFKSLSFEKIQLLRYGFDQLKAMGNLINISEKCDFYEFEEVAAGYILRAETKDQKIYAVYPPIRSIWYGADEKTKETLHTFRMYLENNRIIADTAKDLYVARNTLVYRIKKAMELLDLSMDNRERRLYYLLSFEILNIYDSV